MPILGLGLHVLIAIFFAVHAVRSGQERYWLFVIFMFPLLGSVVYGLAIWLPEASRSRSGQKLVRGLRNSLDPGRDLRDAEFELKRSSTIANRVRVADALHANARHADAVASYRDALQGVHGDDPDIQVKLARALLDDNQAEEARKLLETLIAQQPDYRSSDGHLVYARALAAVGDRAKARDEFDTLIRYYAGLEARVRYIEALLAWGETSAARQLIDESLEHATALPAYARRVNADWIRELKKLRG